MVSCSVSQVARFSLLVVALLLSAHVVRFSIPPLGVDVPFQSQSDHLESLPPSDIPTTRPRRPTAVRVVGNAKNGKSSAKSVGPRATSLADALAEKHRHGAIAPAWAVSHAFEHHDFSHGEAGVVLAAAAALANATSRAGGRRGAHCKFTDHLERREFTHRRKRKNELTNVELFNAVHAEATHTEVLFSGVPPVVNQYPISFPTEWNLQQPFGSWKVVFHEDPLLIGHRHPPQVVPAEPPLYVAFFRGAIIHRGHVVSCEGRLYTAGGCLWESSPPRAEVIAHARRVPIGVALCDSWCKGFYHFSHEHLPRMALVTKLLTTNKDAFLVLADAPNGFQMDFFHSILGVPKEQIVHGTHTADVAVYPMPQRCGNTFTSALYMIRQLVFSRLGLDPALSVGLDAMSPAAAASAAPSAAGNMSSGGPYKLRVLWAERKKLSRMASNWEEIKQRLIAEYSAAAQFDSTFGEHHASEQVAKFFHSDIVVGPHGANIANAMWMRRGSHLIEVSSRAKGNMCYYTTASRLNITYHLLMHNKGKDAKYTLKYEDVARHFRFAVEEVRKRGQEARARLPGTETPEPDSETLPPVSKLGGESSLDDALDGDADGGSQLGSEEGRAALKRDALDAAEGDG